MHVFPLQLNIISHYDSYNGSVRFNEFVQRYASPLRMFPPFMLSKSVPRGVRLFAFIFWTKVRGSRCPVDISQVPLNLFVVLDDFLANQALKCELATWNSVCINE